MALLIKKVRRLSHQLGAEKEGIKKLRELLCPSEAEKEWRKNGKFYFKHRFLGFYFWGSFLLFNIPPE